MVRQGFYHLLSPQMYLRSVFDLPIAYLRERGIRGLIFDLDNTLLYWNALEVTPEAKKLFHRLKRVGFSCCLVSNNKRGRVEVVADMMDLPAIYKARKPSRRAFRWALDTLGTAKNETAVIGDQLFTDVLGGNRFGLYTVLVMPLSKQEFIGTKVMRFFERIVLRRLIEKGLVEKLALEGR
ncbi:MAG TPA: YqeG family HAD IIIA-type phosphatase [bacterium]|jgi:HAD superfamily phosphatase (TIGR01668 family)|nr:YqeG family HAD IIIA-type phosphatase [bacterium]